MLSSGHCETNSFTETASDPRVSLAPSPLTDDNSIEIGQCFRLRRILVLSSVSIFLLACRHRLWRIAFGHHSMLHGERLPYYSVQPMSLRLAVSNSLGVSAPASLKAESFANSSTHEAGAEGTATGTEAGAA